MELVVIADDYGICPARDRGILLLAKQRRLSAASLMVNGLSAASAASSASEVGLPLGLHFNISEGKPISDAFRHCEYLRNSTSETFLNIPPEADLSVTTKQTPITGCFPGRSRSYEYLHQADQALLDAILQEFEAQCELFASLAGYFPARFDSHQHFHLHPRLASLLAVRARELGLKATRCPLERLDACASQAVQQIQRNALDAAQSYLASGITFCAKFYGLRSTAEGFSLTDLQRYLSSCSVDKDISHRCELMCHPGEPDNCWDEFNASADRKRELDFLLSSEFGAILEQFRLSTSW